MDDKKSSFDVAIIGGGPAGTASAIYLARLGHTVLVLEKSNYEYTRIGETLSPSTRLPLIDLGVWDLFIESCPIASHGIKSVWGGNDSQSISFVFNPFGTGWHIDRQKFDVILSNKAAAEGAVIRTGSLVTDIVPKMGIEKKWVIKFYNKYEEVESKRDPPLNGETSFQAKSLLIGTGRSPILVRKLGAQQIVSDSLVGLASRFYGEVETKDSFILIEASEEGWWYSAPVPSRGLIVVFMTDSDIMVRNHLNSESEWMGHFERTYYTKARCSGFTLLAGPNPFLASSQRLIRSVYEDKWLAVGDAALAVDPLSASGIPFALKSGRDAANALDQWLSGDSSAARNYDAQIDNEFHHYLKKRAFYYGLETRWQNSLFWKRRRFINPEN